MVVKIHTTMQFPLFDCHADVGHYNTTPKGTKYSPAELRA